jgi:hypothetical protein
MEGNHSMKKIRTALPVALLALAVCVSASGQTADPGVTANGVIGEVVAVDANSKQLFVRTDAGSVVVASVADSTVFKKLPPGATKIENATDIAFADVAAGDRVFARGTPSDDRKTVASRMVIVMTKADLAKKSEAEREEWRRRGVAGVVTALNPATKEITIQPFGGRPAGGPAAGAAPNGQAPSGGQQAGGPPAPPAPVVIAAGGEGVKFRRYTQTSVKFSDAKSSSFEELKVGDQVRAKGDRSPDGARFTPEEVVSGSFRTVVGTVKEVNPATRELQIVTLEGDKPMTVVLSKDSELKQVPAEFAQMMMRGPGGAGGPGGGPGAGSGNAVVQRGPGGQGGGQGGPGAGQGGAGGPRRMGGGLQEMLERLPAANVEDIKPNTMVVFSTTGEDPAKATAIQLVAGVDPIVQMMQARAAAQNRPLNLGSFNLGIGQP